jgi:hypothetical protein
VDELRVSANTVRSDDWLFATNYTLRDNFVTYSDVAAQSDWLQGYDKRRKITIDNNKIDAALTDFPVYIPIGASVGSDNDDLTDITDDLGSSSNRKKLAVTTADGYTQCWVEIDNEDIANDKMGLHVRVPFISASLDTVLYIYWDSTKTVTDNTYVGDIGETAGGNVWDENFIAVFHMDVPSDANILDSTNGTLGNIVPYNTDSSNKTDGIIGEATLMNQGATANECWHDDNHSPYQEPVHVSVETVCKRTADMTTQHAILCVAKALGQSYGLNVDLQNLTPNKMGFNFHSSSWVTVDDPNTFDQDKWYYFAGTYDKVNARLYRDAAQVASVAETRSLNYSTPRLVNVGAYQYGSPVASKSAQWHGSIDELRISKAARSAAWCKATYYTLFGELVSYSSTSVPTTDDKPFLNGYNKRAKITIDVAKVTEDLIDFPVYIALNDSAGRTGKDITAILTDLGMTTGSRTNAKKMAVTSDDGVTELFVEWDHILTGSDSGLHVKVPLVSSAHNTELYLYWDSTQTVADNVEHVGFTGDRVAKSVWNGDYIVVYHMSEQDGATYKIGDSPDREYDGDLIANNMDASNLVSGKLGQAMDFNGTNESMQSGTHGIFTTMSKVTIETVVFRDTIASSDMTITQYGKAAGQAWGISANHIAVGNTDKFNFSFYNGAWRYVEDPSAHNINQWYHAAGRFDKVNLSIFRDGINTANTPYTGDLQFNTLFGYRVGCYQATGSTKLSYWAGKIDEVRVSRTARSDAWIKATYETLWDNFVTIDDVVTTSSPPAPISLAAAPWLTGFNRRKRVNIDPTNIDENLTDFPVLINISSSSGPDGMDLSDITDDLASTGNRKKIAVTTSNGETQCYVEIAYEDIANDKMELYVKVPTVYANQDTPLFIYWHSTNSVSDNTTYVGDTGSTPANNVWDSNFVGVWHLSQTPSGTGDVKESTGVNSDGTTTNLVAANWVNTPLGKGYEYDQTPTREYVEVAYNAVMAFTDYITLESFDRFDNAARTSERQIDSGNQANTQQPFGLLPLSGKPGFAYRGTDGTFYTYDADVAQVVVDEWAHYAAIHTNLVGTNTAVFFNGTRLAGAWQSGTGNVSRASTYDHMRFGSGRSTLDPWQMIGAQSEIRISKVIRSDAWIKATAKSLHDAILGFGMTLSAPTDEPANNPDWPTGWDGYRVQMQIDHSLIDDTLTDFPIMFSVDGAAGINNVDIRSMTTVLDSSGNRKKVMFTDEGGNKLYAEIEDTVDMVKDILTFHVKVPKVYSAINTVLWAYWDATHASETTYIGDLGETPAQAVWDSNFVSVHHMVPQTGATQPLKDSTGTLTDMARGTAGGTYLEIEGLKNNKALTFNKDLQGDQVHWSMLSEAPHTVTDVSLEVVTRRITECATENTVCQLGKTAGQAYGLNINRFDTDPNQMIFAFYNTAWRSVKDPVAMDIDTWYYFAGTYDEAVLKLYRNAAEAAETVYAGSLDFTGLSKYNFGVYSWTSSTFDHFGQIVLSEVRLSKVARPAEWTKATYHSLFDSLLIFDASGPEGAPTVPPFVPTEAETYTPVNATELTVDGDAYMNNGPLVQSEYWYNVGGPIPELPTAWNIMSEGVDQDTSWQITTENTQDSGWNIQTDIDQDVEWTIVDELRQDTGWNVFAGLLGFIHEFSMKCINFSFDVEEINAHCVDETDDVQEMVPLKNEFCMKNGVKSTFEITRVINENVFILNQ